MVEPSRATPRGSATIGACSASRTATAPATTCSGWPRPIARVVAAAVVGGLADGAGDRWSDLDLTFAVEDAVPLDEVLEDWTRAVAAGLDAVHLFDLPAGAAIYRVFLLPGCLQVDLSFAPASAFGARGPRFRLLFGTAVDLPQAPPTSANELFGLAVHHAVRARFSIERGRWLAGGALDQRRPRPGAAARLPAPRARGRLRPPLRRAAARRCWRRSSPRSSAHSSRRSSSVRSRVRSRCSSRSRRRRPTSPRPSTAQLQALSSGSQPSR